MNTLLSIQSSIFSDDGASSTLARQYVRNFLGFLGIEAVQFVFAEGLALGEESKFRSMAQARAAVAALGSEQRRAA